MDKRKILSIRKSKITRMSKRKSTIYTMECLYCHKPFDITLQTYSGGKGTYCSQRCAKKSNRGKGNPRWKGGKRINRGYIEIKKELVNEKYHYLASTNGYIREHRYVMAKVLNRKLKTDELAHHINGIKDDNRPENLAIVNSSNHEKHTFERVLQKRIRELESEIETLKLKN